MPMPEDLKKECFGDNESWTDRTDTGRFRDGKKTSENIRLDGSDRSDGNQETKCNFLAAVPSFPIGVLPELYQVVVIEHAESFNVPLDIPSMALLTMAGACIGRTRGLTIKSGWSEHPNTYLGIVGRSGTGKSPVIKAIQRPIYRLEAQWFNEYQEELRDYQEALEKRRSTPKKDKANLGPPPEPPTYRQLIIDDSTTEALTDALTNNPRGIQWNRDELSGLILELDKYTGKDGGTKARLMSAYDSGPWKVNRTGKNKFIPKACLSIFGTIQDKALPVIFSSMDAATGFLPRFNFIRVEQDKPPLWTDQTVSEASKAIVSSLYDELLRYAFQEEERPYFIGVKKPAKDLFIEWYNEQALEPWGDCDASVYEAVLAKLRGQCLRFALILHCMDAAASRRSEKEPVGEETMGNALILADYLKAHQKSVWELCFQGATLIQLKPFERRIAQAIIDHEQSIQSGMIPTSLITDHLNAGMDKRFHVKPEAVGRSFKGMGINTGHLPDKSGRGPKITPEILENLKKVLGIRPNRPTCPNAENIKEKWTESTVREPSEPSEKVKCVQCSNLDGFTCRLGHECGGIQLLRECSDYREYVANG